MIFDPFLGLQGVYFEKYTRQKKSSFSISHVKVLPMGDNPKFGDEGVQGLVNATLTKLVLLDLRNCGLSGKSARALAKSGLPTTLKELWLSGNPKIKKQDRALLNKTFHETKVEFN